MTNDAKHLLRCFFKDLFIISISYSVQIFFSFLYWFIFLLLSFKCSLNTLDTSALPDRCFANNFCLGLPFYSLSDFTESKLLILIKSNQFFSMARIFDVLSKKSLPTQSHLKFLLCYPLGVL